MPFISASAISPYNSIRGGAGGGLVPAALLLDLYPNAAAAYSLRKLRTAYTSSAIRVRRSSDNTETDIGFVDNELDTVSLLSFVGANNGFVTVWYDQSGEGNNFIQPTAANQPKIINSGSILFENGLPCLLFNGTNNAMYVFNNSLSPIVFRDISDSISFISVEKPNVITGSSGPWFNSKTMFEIRSNNITAKVPINFGYSDSKLGYGATDNYIGDAEIIFSSTLTNNQKIVQSFVDNDLVQIFSNNSSVGSGSFVSSSSNRSIGLANSTMSLGVRSRDGGQLDNSYYSGNLQEIILYKTNELSNRTGIETNINSHYLIY